MDFSKLSNGLKIALIGGIVAIINLFLPWFSVDAGVVSASGNAFDFTLGWLGSFLIIAAAILLALKAFGRSEASLGNLKVEQIAVLLAGLGTVLVLIKLIIGEDPSEIVDRSVGVFLGVIVGAAVTFGAFLAMKDAGLDLPGADDFKSIGGGDEPPPPPSQ